MRADKLLPGSRGLPLWCRWDAVALENVAHSLITERIAQVGQRADDPVIPPGAVLLGHAHHQGLDLLVDRGTAGSLALLGTVKLFGDQCAMPGEDGVRFHDRCHFRQCLLPQLLADLGQGPALAITQPEAPLYLIAEDA